MGLKNKWFAKSTQVLKGYEMREDTYGKYVVQKEAGIKNLMFLAYNGPFFLKFNL